MSRLKWPIPKWEQLVDEVRSHDETTPKERVDRYKFVLEEFGPPVDMLPVGGIPAMFAIYELKRSFVVAGNYLATILVAQVFIEHSLGGTVILAGNDKIAEIGFATLIDISAQKGITTADLAHRLHELRKM